MKRWSPDARRQGQLRPLATLLSRWLEQAETLIRSGSQSVIVRRGRNVKYLPYVFTEHGAIRSANALNSPPASA